MEDLSHIDGCFPRSNLNLTVRPESHDQVFLYNFLASMFFELSHLDAISCSASCQTELSGFFSKQIAEAITRIFFR